jgi:hypothetical protein
MADMRRKTRNWYGVAEGVPSPKPRRRVDTSLAPIRIRYRGIEFFGKVGIRFLEPGAELTARRVRAPRAGPSSTTKACRRRSRSASG